jgi:23S rRNA (guanosine2251-2'-O)-methyltransferase
MKLSGKNPVYERLRLNPQTIRKIYLQQGFEEAAYVRGKAAKTGIPVLNVVATKMQKIGRDRNTQGIMAEVGEFEYADFNDLLEQAVRKKRTLVFLDGITDPQNLGAIIRSLGSLGRFSLVLPTKEAVEVTEAVLRVASGGENHVPIAQVSNLNNAIDLARQEGFAIVGTVTQEGQSLYDALLPARLALVIGSEQKGIRPGILKNLDVKLTVPMHVETMSLNVATATAVFCYEIIRQTTERKKASKPSPGD